MPNLAAICRRKFSKRHTLAFGFRQRSERRLARHFSLRLWSRGRLRTGSCRGKPGEAGGLGAVGLQHPGRFGLAKRWPSVRGPDIRNWFSSFPSLATYARESP